MKRARPFAVVTAVAVLLACDTLAGPDEAATEAPLQTDRSAYTLRSTSAGVEGEIPFTYTNTTGETVYVVNCRGSAPPVLEKQVGDRWEVAWAAVVPLCLSPPIVIEEGETYTDTLRIFGAHPGSDWHPRFRVAEVEGTYRLVWHDVVHDYDEYRQGFGDPLPLEERVSNTFTLREE